MDKGDCWLPEMEADELIIKSSDIIMLVNFVDLSSPTLATTGLCGSLCPI